MSVNRELLFGLLALQNGLIDRETLIAVFQAWMKDKSQSLAAILVQRNSGSAEEFDLLNRLVDLHVSKHGGDSQQSLASLSSLDVVTQQLQELGDADIYATLTSIKRDPNSKQSDAGSLDTVQSPMSAAIGTNASTISRHLSRFRILRPHARGGLGEVFVAQDAELNRDVALKEIQSRFADDTASRSRFILEAEVTGGLEHPGIVPVYGLGQYEDGRPYYAMRFVKGDSLKEAIDAFHGKGSSRSGKSVDEQTSSSAVLDYHGVHFRKLLGRFVDVCQAISYAHSRGVLHRDLKPGNIMLGKYGETLVVDWGLAKVQGRDEKTSALEETSLTPASGSGVTPTVMGSAIGTPGYMPPEQAAGRLDEMGPASDVYSLGATLYHLLTGQVPFSGKSISELLQKVKNGNYVAPRLVNPKIPKALEAICTQAMAVNRHDRYASPQGLADDIERFLADNPVLACREPMVVRARRWIRKHQTLAATTSTLLLVSAVGLGIFSSILSGKNSELNSANQDLADANQSLSESITRESEARRLAESNEKAAREQSAVALTTLASVIDDIQGGLAAVPGGGEVRRRLLNTSLEKLESVSTKFLAQTLVDDVTWKALVGMGDVIASYGAESPGERSGDSTLRDASRSESDFPSELEVSALQLATSYYERAFEIAKALSNANPEDTYLRGNLSISNNKLGEVYRLLGRIADAEVHYEASLKLERLTEQADPSNSLAGRNVTVSLNNLGSAYLFRARTDDARVVFEESLRILRRLVESEPDNQILLRDQSATFNKLGEAYSALGRTTEAMEQYENGLAISRALAEKSPEDTEAQDDLANSFSNLGDASMLLGRYVEAGNYYADALIISRKLAAEDSSNVARQRELAFAINNVGKVPFALGKFDDGLKHLLEAYEVMQELADNDPTNTRYQNDLSISFERIGNTHKQLGNLQEALRQYERCAEIRVRLAELDPSNVTWQSNLGIAYGCVASVLLAQDQTDDARIQFEKVLGIDRSLVSTDPDNTKYKINLGYSLSMLGETCENLGRGDDGIAYLRESLEVSREISEADPENAEKLGNFRAANMKIAMTHLAREEFALAVEPMDAVITISRIMIEKGIKVEETREFLTYFEPDVLDTRRKVIAIGAWENLLQQPADELPGLLVSRGLVLSNRSQFADAAEAVEKFMKMDVTNNEQLYDAACVFGRCAASIQAADGGDLTPDQSSQRQVWITNAISALEKSIANGWTDRELMMEDADLAILRELPEFKALAQPAETGELQDSNKP